jgi:hypothetical protein
LPVCLLASQHPLLFHHSSKSAFAGVYGNEQTPRLPLLRIHQLAAVMAEAAGSGPLPAEDVAADAAQPPTATQRFIYENRNTVAALVASFCSTIAGFPLDSVKYVVSTPFPITFFGTTLLATLRLRTSPSWP